MNKEERRKESIRVLGFDPYTQEYQAVPGLYELTPAREAYLLEHHNNNNRKFKPTQLKNLDDSIVEHGFQNDGDALRIDTEGNIPEYQHRLDRLLYRGMTVHVPLVLGVSPDSFTKTAKAKPRSNFDEVWRKDKTTEPYEVATMSSIIHCITQYGSGLTKLRLDNAAAHWNEWKSFIRIGEKLTESFFDGTTKWNPWRRNFAAWATLMSKHDEGNIAKKFLKMLEDATKGKESTPLARDFKKFWEQEEVSYLKNTQRPKVIWCMLCVSADRLAKHPDGDCELNLNLTECTHGVQKRQGHYRMFHLNPDNIK